MENLLGVILCGGESTRMGSDKGLIETNGESWAGSAARKLSALGLPVVISINELQFESYSKIFAPANLIIDNIDIRGPLRGLLSVHNRYQDRDILLMACDLVDMDETTISDLIARYKLGNDHDFYVYQENFAEPFCAIYTSKGLKPVLEKAKAHSLEKFSFQTMLDQGNTARIPITRKSSFRNYNTITGHHQPS